MDFLGIGPWELLLILFVGLLVMGPTKLPEMARTVGRITRQLRKVVTDATQELTAEVDESKKTVSSIAQDLTVDTKKTVSSIAQDLTVGIGKGEAKPAAPETKQEQPRIGLNH